MPQNRPVEKGSRVHKLVAGLARPARGVLAFVAPLGAGLGPARRFDGWTRGSSPASRTKCGGHRFRMLEDQEDAGEHQ